MKMKVIDMTPTWGEIGNIYHQFAMSGEKKALKIAHPEMARAFALAQAMVRLSSRLSPELQKEADEIIEAELKKQGIQ